MNRQRPSNLPDRYSRSQDRVRDLRGVFAPLAGSQKQRNKQIDSQAAYEWDAHQEKITGKRSCGGGQHLQ